MRVSHSQHAHAKPWAWHPWHPALIVAALAAALFASNALAASPIVLPRCRVLLIDQVTLASEMTGVLDFVTPEEGDRVEAKAVVAGLKREPAAAALAVAERQATDDTELRFSKKAAELARTEFDRMQILFRKNVVSESDFQKAKLEHERAVLQVEKSESQLVVNRLSRDEKLAQYNAFLIRAPFEGRVTRVFRRPGEAVRQGDPVLEVVSTRRLRVEGYLDARLARHVQPGDRAAVRPLDDESAAAIPARVVFVDDSVEPNSRTVRVWAEVVNEAGALRAGLAAEMTIRSATEPDAPAIGARGK